MIKALIAEPDEMLRTVLGLVLKKRGFDVEYALSSEQLLNKTAQGDFNLLLIDWNIAPKKGSELIRKIRSSEKNKIEPIFIVATYTDDEVRTEMLNAGANHFIEKPFEFETLIQIIGAAIQLDN